MIPSLPATPFRRMLFPAIAVAALALAAPVPGHARAVTHGEANPTQQPQVPTALRPAQFPLGVTFEATALNGRAYEGEPPAMILDDTLRMRGFAGCNNYSATAYPLQDQGLAVGPFALTRRQCDQGTMARERAFLEALRAGQRWSAQGATLTIEGPRGTLTFERAL